MGTKTIAVLVTITFSVIGVLGDYFLKLASAREQPLRTSWFYLGFALFTDTRLAAPGFSTLVIILLFFDGLIFLYLGILGEYIGQRVLLAVEDNGEGGGEKGDRLTWALARPSEGGWTPTDAFTSLAATTT